ncbi:MAG: preprotein translocase subunit SecY [Planctomycetota bacterium]|jgi:preprotein translocase subunit SecY|nr:preprotein translocase subunit SecY [Planctomycetota bacterium]
MADPEIGGNPYQQLLKRFAITLLLGVVVYRLGAWVPVPGINVDVLRDRISGDGSGEGAVDAVLRWANMFNGGTIANGSVFGLGIMPYISASIIIQLMAFSFPALKALQKEGEVGKRKLNQYTRYVTVGICSVQSLLAGLALAKLDSGVFLQAGVNQAQFIAQTVLVVTCGSMVLLWLAEQITKHGVGNGVSVIIMIGILAGFPPAIGAMFDDPNTDLSKFLLLAGVFILIVAGMVVVTQARRFLNMEQQRRVKGNQVYGGANTKLPLMLNQAGVIPVIFSSPVMVVLVMAFSGIGLAGLLDHGGPGYRYLFAAMIVFFTYFYISITVDLNDWANNFKQSGFFVRGIKPGRNTVDYIHRILMRITFIGAISLAVITIMPSALGTALGLSGPVAQMILGGVGLLIVVGVSLDVIQKVSAFLLAHQYQGMMAGGGPGGKPGGAPASSRYGKKAASKRF